MTTILQINSAARSQGAQSTLLATELVAKLKSKFSAAEVTVRDLLNEGTTHLNDDTLGAFFTPADKRSAAQEQVVERSDALIKELQAADVIVLGVPMYNFGISSQLKAYFDWIARAGVTFRYTPEGRPEGLVTGKKVYIVAARGGKYFGTPNDTQTPYLKTFLGFLGMTDVEFIYAEGLAMGEAAANDARASARQAIAAL